MNATEKNIIFRQKAKESDHAQIKELLESSDFFYDYEIKIALELFEEYLEDPKESGYYFIFAEQDDRVVAYTCSTFISYTVSSYDLYWLAVHADLRAKGIGKAILGKTEKLVAELGGTRLYAETSGRPKYEPTRFFYEKCSYKSEARLKDFYSQGDDKIIMVKELNIGK